MTRINPGLPLKAFPAKTWNDMLARLDALELGNKQSPRGIQERSGQLVVWVVPDEDIIEHGVVVFDEYAWTLPTTSGDDDEGTAATLGEPVVMVKAPTDETIGKPVFITLEPIASGKPGRAVRVGLAVARVDMAAADDTTCGPIADDGEKLQSGTGDIAILQTESDGEETGVQWAVVELGTSAGIRSLTQYAVVLTEASVAAYSGTAGAGTFKVCLAGAPSVAYGGCVLLEKEIVADAWTGCYVMPTPGGGETMADYELRLANMYDEVPLKVGRLIRVTNTDGATIPRGPYGSVAPAVFGEYVRPFDYIRALSTWNAAADQILYHEADDGELFKLGGAEC